MRFWPLWLLLAAACVPSRGQPNRPSDGGASNGDAIVFADALADSGVIEADSGLAEDADAPDLSVDTGVAEDAGFADADAAAPDAIVRPDALPVDVGQGSPLYVAAGFSRRRTASTDGVRWVNDVLEPTVGGDADYLRGIGYGAGMFIAVGGTSQVGLIYTTTDGANWNFRGDNFNWLGGAAYGENVWVLVGALGRRLRSTDGITFTPTAQQGGHLRNVAYGNGQFIAVGDGGRRIVSPDGQTWMNEVTGGFDLYGIVYGNGIWVATGIQGRRVRSIDDGMTWQNDVSGGGPIVSITYGQNMFLGVANGAVWTSTDAVSWTNRASPPINRAVFGNNMWVGSGNGDRRYTSPDGVTWTERANSGLANYGGIAFGLTSTTAN